MGQFYVLIYMGMMCWPQVLVQVEFDAVIERRGGSVSWFVVVPTTANDQQSLGTTPDPKFTHDLGQGSI
jgi:hypothetical protein